MTGNYVKPSKPSKRIAGLDILRGFALLGILLVNVLGFNASFFDFGGFYQNLPDDFQRSFYNVFISLTADKFIFLFSFLFGYGIYMQYEKTKKHPLRFSIFFIRRMLLLAVFGITHIVLLWAGDILFVYAIAGLVMLLFHKLRTRWLLLLSVFFYFFIVFWLIAEVWIVLPNGMSSTCPECFNMAEQIYKAGNYFQCLNLRLEEYVAFRNINIIYYLTKVIGVVITGFIAGKFGFYQIITTKRKRSGILMTIFIMIGIALYFGFEKLVPSGSSYSNALYMLGYETMNFFVAGAYMLIVLFLISFKFWSRILRPIALIGRMSLTNYLLQSVVLSFIFYGWGFGLFGHTNVILLVIIAILIYICQLFWTAIWLSYYKYGPLEKWWRNFAYSRQK